MKEVENKSYEIESINPDRLIGNNKAIADLSKTLSDITNWRGTSTNYENVIAALNALTEYSSDKLMMTSEQATRYIKLANKADAMMSKYLSEKKLTVFSSSYAHKRVDTMKELQVKIKQNIESMKLRQIELDALEAQNYIQNYMKKEENTLKKAEESSAMLEERKALFARHRKYGLSTSSNKDIYHGDNYTSDSLKSVYTASLQVSRTGPYSLALLALASEKDDKGNYKYSFDELLDPDKLNKEKADMFKKVIEAYNESADPATQNNTVKAGAEKVAGLMYDGMKRGSELLNEQLKGMDFNNPETLKSDAYIKVCVMSEAMFDVAQEVAHVDKEVLEEAKKDGYDFKKITDYQKHAQALTGVLGDLGNAMYHLNDAENNYQKKIASGNNAESDMLDLISYGAKVKLFEDVLKEYNRETKGQQSFTDWYVKSGWAECYDTISAGIRGEIVMHFDGFTENAAKSTKESKDIHDEVLSGQYFDNLKFNRFTDKHPGLKNLYGYNEIVTHKDIENSDKIRESFSIKYKELDAKKEGASPEEIAIIKKAQKSLTSLADRMLIGEQVNDDNRAEIIKDVSNIIGADMIDKLKEAGVSNEQLGNAVDGALKEYDFETTMSGINMNDAYYYGFKSGSQRLMDDNIYLIDAGVKSAEVNVTYNEKKANVEAKKKQLEQEVAVSSAEAVARMENYTAGTYKNEKEFFKDAATIVTGIIYNETGRLPKSKTTGKTYTLEEYADLLAKSDSFKNSFRKEDGRLRNPKAVVRRLSDPQSVKEILSSAGKTVNQTRQRSKSVHVRKQTKNTKKQEVKRPSA